MLRTVLWAAVFASGCTGVASDVGADELRATLVGSAEHARSLPADQRARLAGAIELAMRAQRAHDLTSVEAEMDVRAILSTHDEPRRVLGTEPVVLLEVAPGLDESSVRVSTIADGAEDAGRLGAALPVELVVVGSDEPVELPEVVTFWLARLVAGRDVHEVVLTEAMPAAAALYEGRVHLNPVWLALLHDGDGSSDGVGVSVAALDEPGADPPGGPLEHHRTASTGFGCYSGGSSCPGFFGGGPCRCGYCGCDCGECATEIGDTDCQGIHCAVSSRGTASRAPHGPECRAAAADPGVAAPLEPFWIAAPLAVLWWIRRRA